MKLKYRRQAEQNLERAKTELESDDPARVVYAAIELRMALEALIYFRAEDYKDELSNKKLSTWQPRKLLSLLLELDPFADQTYTLHFAPKDKGESESQDFKCLGKNRILTLSEIKKYYDRLGSYLHTPTIEQIDRNKQPQPNKIKERCLEICKILNEVFDSVILRVDFKVTASTNCDNCSEKIIRRIPPGKDIVIATCINCDVSYELKSVDDVKVLWRAKVQKIKCLKEECEEVNEIWESHIKEGYGWNCKKCNSKHKIVLGVSFTPEPIKETTSD